MGTVLQYLTIGENRASKKPTSQLKHLIIYVMNDLSCSAGPLGDQIVRGETAAPTGRNKDRARMDEDEVGGGDNELLLSIQQNLSPKC